jgi:diguanylate cyclase (GGDEF)-like protein
LVIDHPVVGAPLELSAGARGRAETERIVTVDGGHLQASIDWAAPPQGVEMALFDDVLDALADSIARSESARQLREQLEVDPLTGIGNRRRGARALAAAISRAERHAEAVSVLALDLDHFKPVNDHFGHGTGDAVLQAFAAMLACEVRPYDTVVRTGGDEFLLICPTIDSVGARALAARLRDNTPLRCAAALPDDGPRQTVSIGIAVYPEAADYPDGLVRKADGALLEAKRAGRNTVMVAALPDRPPSW